MESTEGSLRGAYCTRSNKTDHRRHREVNLPRDAGERTDIRELLYYIGTQPVSHTVILRKKTICFIESFPTVWTFVSSFSQIQQHSVWNCCCLLFSVSYLRKRMSCCASSIRLVFYLLLLLSNTLPPSLNFLCCYSRKCPAIATAPTIKQ